MRRWTRRIAVSFAAALVGTMLWYGLDARGRAARAVRVLDLGPAAITTETATGAVSLLAFNIAHGRGAGPDNFNGEPAAIRATRLDAIAAELRGHDLVVLNEVDFDAAWSHGVDQAETLARLAGFRYVAEQRNYDFAFPGFALRFGNAVLSHAPLNRCRRLEYPARSAWEARMLGHKRGLLCETTLRGRPVRALAVHLEHRDEATRVRSSQYILQHLGPGPDVVMLGDFNSAPVGAPGARPDPEGRTAVGTMLEGGAFRTGPVHAATFPAWRPAQRIDWILVPRAWRVLEERVIPTPHSDHAALRSRVAIEKERDPDQSPSRIESTVGSAPDG